MRISRPSPSRSPLAAGIVISILLSGCTLSIPHSTQTIALGSLVDPALEPLQGCDALNGEWENQGVRLNNQQIDSAILTGAMGIDELDAAAAFADRVRIARQDDGSLSLTMLDKTSTVGSISIAAKDLQCASDGVQLRKPSTVRIAVDAQDSLWLYNTRGLLALNYSYRFLPVGHAQAVCAQRGACSWGAPAPDGMATVMVGAGDLQANIIQVDDKLDTIMLQRGAASQTQTVYLLPGAHSFSVMVWTPGTYWRERPKTTLTLQSNLQACHVYLPAGWHREGSESWASLIDMGPSFQRDCVSTPTSMKSAIRLSEDATKLLVEEYCFSSTPIVPKDAPPREFPLPGIRSSEAKK